VFNSLAIKNCGDAPDAGNSHTVVCCVLKDSHSYPNKVEFMLNNSGLISKGSKFNNIVVEANER